MAVMPDSPVVLSPDQVRPVAPGQPCACPTDTGYHWDCPHCGWHCYHRVVADIPQTHTTRAALAADPLCRACTLWMTRQAMAP